MPAVIHKGGIITVRRGRTVVLSYPGGGRIVFTYPSRWRAYLAHRYLKTA